MLWLWGDVERRNKEPANINNIKERIIEMMMVQTLEAQI